MNAKIAKLLRFTAKENLVKLYKWQLLDWEPQMWELMIGIQIKDILKKAANDD
jgi:hypothetical protein